MRGPEPSECHRGQKHTNCEPDSADKPRTDAGRDLRATRGGKARAERVEEPHLDPVASERRPEHQQGGDGPEGCTASECGNHGAGDDRNCARAQHRCAKGLSVWLPLRCHNRDFLIYSCGEPADAEANRSLTRSAWCLSRGSLSERSDRAVARTSAPHLSYQSVRSVDSSYDGRGVAGGIAPAFSGVDY
jgi:hypothetical protein